MQSKLTKFFALVLAAALVCSLCSGCSQREPSPNDTILQLESAINQLDTEAILSCISSTRAQLLRSILTMNFGDGNLSAEKCISILRVLLPFLPLASRGAIRSKDLPRVSLTVRQVEQDGKDAVVSLSGILTWADNQQEFSASIPMELEDGKWVIGGA